MRTVRIPLHSRKYPNLYAIVDEADAELVSGYRWGVLVCDGKPRYAVHRHKRRVIMMHRVILGFGDADPDIDHADGDGFNNTRGNLRPATQSQNMMNRFVFANSSTGIKGVSRKRFASGRSKWRAQIQVNGKKRHLGYFDAIEDAAEAYERAARELHGDYARAGLDAVS